MLNRRILRIKAFKALYSYAENAGMDSAGAVGQLRLSCESTRDLYLFMLDIIPALTDEALSRIEAVKGKINPTPEELSPNMKFTTNTIAPILREDPDFRKIISKKKISWDQYDALVRSLYESIREKEWFKTYLESGANSLQEDAALFVKIFEEEFVDNEELEKILEDLSIFWIDDLAYALTWCCYTMNDFARGRRWSLPPLYMSEVIEKKDPTVESDKDFVEKLLRSAVASYGRYSEMIASSVTQWEKDRLFTTDTVLICLGLAEAATFPQIPVKVTINEYVEISKYYSTPKSRAFVNSLLDKLIQQLAAEGGIVKSGAGLK